MLPHHDWSRDPGRRLDPQALGQLEAWITPRRAGEVLQAIADTPAPSQVAAWTLGPIVERFLTAWDVPQTSWDANFQGTGNGVLRLGTSSRRPVWILAHWDVISFMVGQRDGNTYTLVPFHHHLMFDGSQPGAALRYDLAARAYDIVARGTIEGGTRPTFECGDAVPLRSGDRIFYDTPVRWLDEDRLQGQMDNAAGCAGVLLAAAFLSRLRDVEAVVCFVDEEEGPVAPGNTAFARGSPRLVGTMPHPDVAIVVDTHTLEQDEEPFGLGKGALLREYASQARGAVTPPWLFESVRQLAADHAGHVELYENARTGRSRSDCITMMRITPNVILCGAPCIGRHYARGPYVCSAFDVAHLARSLVMLAMRFQPALF
jgi:putative aminopeptidase FrvX